MSMTDTEAREMIEDRDAILFALSNGRKISFYELQNKIDITAKNIARTIHSLKEEGLVQVAGFGEQKIYSITDRGRLAVPPPPVPNFRGPDCDPRKKKAKGKKHTERVGVHSYTHVKGVVGKVAMDHDGSILLDPEKLLGKIYFLLNNKKEMTANEIAEKLSDHSITSIWSSNRELIKLGLIEYDKINNARVYRQSTKKARSFTDASKPTTTPVIQPNIETAPESPYDIAEPSLPTLVEAPPKQKSDLEQKINSLLSQFSVPEIMLELTARLSDDYQLIDDLKRRFQG